MWDLLWWGLIWVAFLAGVLAGGGLTKAGQSRDLQAWLDAEQARVLAQDLERMRQVIREDADA